MSAIQKKKLCWNCEGRVSLEEENCPYCAVYLGPAPDEEGKQDVLAPPYRLVETEEDQVQGPLESPYEVQDAALDDEDSLDLDVARSGFKQVVLPLALLSAGSLFFLFGLMLLIFSEQGKLTLSWNANSWYIYVLTALPAVIFGWVILGKADYTKKNSTDS